MRFNAIRITIDAFLLLVSIVFWGFKKALFLSRSSKSY
ncbi:putative membrane protein [Helicobacter pylori NQ4200]|uniref:Putative membrane protein n=1 Tax=Helicobacter pylori NQ4200 TaxID=992024 RepID=I9PY61_HELPX|nr:putative membrane protein [Helicobacter pylori NQ4200]